MIDRQFVFVYDQCMKETWLSFIALLFVLIGLYCAIHTAYNFTLPQYPQVGVLSINTSGNPPAVQRTSDCMYSQIYYEDDGKTLRAPTAGEKKQNQMDTQRCLRGISETRTAVKMSDINVSVLFLFVGLGLMFSPRFLKK